MAQIARFDWMQQTILVTNGVWYLAAYCLPNAASMLGKGVAGREGLEWPYTRGGGLPPPPPSDGGRYHRRYPLPTAARSPAAPYPQDRTNRESPEETGQRGRETHGEVTGQGRPSRADAHPSAHKSVLESANPAWARSVHLDSPGQRHGQQPVSGTADPGVVQQDKSCRGR